MKYGIRDLIRKKNFQEMEKSFYEKANGWLEEIGPLCYLPIAQVIKKFEGKARKNNDQELLTRAESLWQIAEQWSNGKTALAWDKYVNSMS